MKRPIEEGRKIPFFFTPFPNLFFETEFFANANLIKFALWALRRTSFANGEFIFGRQQCSQETGVSEQRLRTIVNQLTNQQLILKVTSKSTNKYTIYKWLWEHFSHFANQQCNRKSTSNQPQTNHITDIDIEKEQQQRAASAPLAAASFSLEGKAKKLLDLLPSHERDAIASLYRQRIKTQPIANPDAWFIKCMEEGWHLENKIILPEVEAELSDFCKNKAFAEKLVQQFASSPGHHICLRNDFLELGWDKCHQWQIFFSEASKVFVEQVEFALRKMRACEL